MTADGPQPPDPDTYDFAPAPAPPKPARAVRGDSIASPKPVIAYQSAAQKPVSPADPQSIMSIYAPWMLAGSVAVEVVAAYFKERNFRLAIIGLGIGLVLGTIVKVAGILLLGRLRQIDFGPFWMSVLKLAAVTTVTDAVFILVYPLLMFIPLGGLLGLGGQFVLFFALLGALFNLDEQDTWYCVFVFFLLDLAVYFLWVWALGR